MPRDMFGSITDPPVHVGTKNKYSVPLAFLAHLAVLVPLIVIPILAADVLPDPPVTLVILDHPTPPKEPPVIKRTVAEKRPAVNPDAAPVIAQEGIQPETPYQLEPFEGDTPDGDILEGVDSIDTLTPPPPAPVAAKQDAVRPGGDVRPPTKIHDVAPVYPAIAQAAGVHGVVIIEALLDVDGRVQQARVLRSIPLLDQAALDAVRQWQYTPTRLNGQPVPVLMTVTVTFVLRR